MAVMAITMGVLAEFYAPLLRDPGGYLFNGQGDGLKNYFAFGYHVKHDSSLMQFEGMNHPFGGQIGNPDAQPALSGATKLTAVLFPRIREHTPTIINLAALFSIALTALSIYLILVRLGAHWVYAGLGGAALALCSPQLLRLEAAHHGLSYGWSITLPIYCFVVAFTSRNAWKMALVGGATIGVGLYLHPYAGMIAACLLGFTLLILAPGLVSRKAFQRLFALGFLVAAPILMFLLVQALTDHHVGRAAHPLGFFDYRSSWNNVFSAPSGYRSALSRWLFPGPMDQIFEGTAYVGLGGLLGGIVVFPMLIGRMIASHLKKAPPSGWPLVLSALLLGSIPLSAFSFGWPFSVEDGLFPWSIPFIGQFRSPGRFGWAMYYTLGLFALYGGWWLWAQAKGKTRVVAFICMGAIPLLYLYDGIGYHRAIGKSITRDRNVLDARLLNSDERTLLGRVAPHKYKALITVPNFLTGAEEIGLPANDEGMYNSMLISYYKGIPMMSFSMARTSVTEAFQQLGLLTPPWYPRPIGGAFDPEDRFLIVATGAPANDHEENVIERARSIGAVGRVRLLSISASDLFKDRTKELFEQLTELHRTGPPVNGWSSTSIDPRIHYFDLDDKPAKHVYHGSGAYSGLKRETNAIALVPAGGLLEGKDYVASYWYYNKGPLRCHTLTCVAERDPATGKEEWIVCSDARYGRIVNGDWTMVELPFTTRIPGAEYRIFTEGQRVYTDSIWVDEVMVRPAHAASLKVLEEKDGKLRSVLYNGHHLTLPQ